MSAEQCPEPSRVAAYVDGRLDVTERRLFESHMANCPECPLVVGETVRFLAETQQGDSSVRPLRTRWTWVAVAACVVALPIAMLTLRSTPLDDIREIAARAPARTIEGRLEGFPHKSFTSTRSEVQRDSDLALRGMIERLRDERGRDAVHARAIAVLMDGDPAEAVRLLSTVAHTAGSAESWNDLAVAQLAVGAFSDALHSADRALQVSPSQASAHFNRAVALEHLGRTGEAAKTYRRAFDLEPPSPWRDETANRLADLTGR